MFKNLTNDYYTLMDKGDPRVKDLPLTESPFPTIGLCLTYVLIVKKLGIDFMENRKPLNVRYLMIFYNIMMVALNSYIFFYAGVYGWFGKYSFKCQPMDYSHSRDALGMVNISWVFFISKFIDFFDTFFFIMRKKYSHISNLHVIHHGLMPLVVWSGLKFAPGKLLNKRNQSCVTYCSFIQPSLTR